MHLEHGKPLFSFSRKAHKEVIVNGWDVFSNHNKLDDEAAGKVATYARSLLKPWQFMAADVFGSEDFWAVGLASHSGESRHLNALNAMARSQDLDLANLACPISLPMNPAANAKLVSEHRPKERTFHPCSGKHLMLLAECKKAGYSNDYIQADHPLQKRIIALVEDLVGRKLDWATDGCGLQTPYLTISEHLSLWHSLASSTSLRQVALKDLWAKNPFLVGGEGRLDSEIVEACHGKVLAKEGADGMIVVQSLRVGDEPLQSCMIKINSGFSAPYLGLALWAKLKFKAQSLNTAMNQVLSFLEKKHTDWVPKDQSFEAFKN